MGPEMSGGPGNKLGAQRAEQFPHLGNYTLTPEWDGDARVGGGSLKLCCIV